MRYLITGASGFIGRHLVSHLLAQGHEITYLSRQRAPSVDVRTNHLAWDGKTEPQLERLGDLDAVVHLAGESVSQRWNAEIKKRIVESRSIGTRVLVDAIGKLKSKPKILVSASAIGYYGSRGNEVLTEASPPGRGFLADVCVSWEREAARAREFGIRVVPLRISVVLDAHGGALPRMLLPFKLGLGGRIGTGQQWMSWIHKYDLVRLIEFAANDGTLDTPVNGSSPNPVTNTEFTRLLAQRLHRPAILPVPRFALRMVAGELAEHMVASAQVIPQIPDQHQFRFTYPTLEHCLANLLP